MDRRQFVQAAGMAVTASAISSRAYAAENKKRRVGLIGCGWYGKCDLMQLCAMSIRSCWSSAPI
jgi:hypothetical protein